MERFFIFLFFFILLSVAATHLLGMTYVIGNVNFSQLPPILYLISFGGSFCLTLFLMWLFSFSKKPNHNKGLNTTLRIIFWLATLFIGFFTIVSLVIFISQTMNQQNGRYQGDPEQGIFIG